MDSTTKQELLAIAQQFFEADDKKREQEQWLAKEKEKDRLAPTNYQALKRKATVMGSDPRMILLL